MNGFESQYQTQSSEIVADAGYGSQENYELMEAKAIKAYVKYNYFHKEQKRRQQQNPFLVQNLFYNHEKDFFVCPMGQKMNCIGTGKRTSSNAYQATVSYYQAQNCQGCPLRSLCHNSKTNRRIEVNHRLNALKFKAKERLNSEKGKQHRSKRPIEVEAVFGQLKSNNKFTRFTLKGLEKIQIEFGLMALAHNLRKLSRKQYNNFQKTFSCDFKTSKNAVFIKIDQYEQLYQIAA